MASLIDEQRQVNIVFLDFRKVFDIVLHKTVRKKLKYELDEQTVR